MAGSQVTLEAQHAKEEERRSQPRHVVDRKSGDSHQCQHHQKEHECDAAALYDSVSRIIFEGTPENERVKGKKPYASCHVYSVGVNHCMCDYSTPNMLGCWKSEKHGLVRTWKVSAFYKGESQGKNFPGDWKERKCSLRFPAHGVLRVSEDFFFFQIHLVIVTALLDSEARQAAWLKCVNHGSI